MTDPTTPRPDPVTEARRQTFETFREVIREYTYQPFGQAEAQELCSRLTDAALARAEAGVSVEALAAHYRHTIRVVLMADGSASLWCRSCDQYLAARSAGSGSQVEHTPLEDNSPVWCEEHHEWEARRAPPPTVGTMTDAEGAAFLAGIRPTPPPVDVCEGCGAPWKASSHEPPRVACCPDCTHIRPTPPPAVDGTRESDEPPPSPARARVVRSTPSPDAVDGTRDWWLPKVCAYQHVPGQPPHWHGMTYHDPAHTPPDPDPDRLRALEAVEVEVMLRTLLEQGHRLDIRTHVVPGSNVWSEREREWYERRAGGSFTYLPDGHAVGWYLTGWPASGQRYEGPVCRTLREAVKKASADLAAARALLADGERSE